MLSFQDVINQCGPLKKLEVGGQKTVYKGHHAAWGDVVVKHGKYIADSTLIRITREVNLLKSLDAKFFPKNFEFTVDPNLQEFLIVEEYLDALPLSDAKSRFQTEEQVINLGYQIIIGMEIIWDKRIVHRDLKPPNILITAQDEPKIIDFGIARFLDESSLTKTVYSSGPATARYAAPEQLLNKKQFIDIRTDFFALGIILAELVLGFHPFDPIHARNGSSIRENIVAGQHIDFSSQQNLSPAFATLLNRLLQDQPYKRFRDAAVLRRYLDENWNIQS